MTCQDLSGLLKTQWTCQNYHMDVLDLVWTSLDFPKLKQTQQDLTMQTFRSWYSSRMQSSQITISSDKTLGISILVTQRFFETRFGSRYIDNCSIFNPFSKKRAPTFRSSEMNPNNIFPISYQFLFCFLPSLNHF